MEEIRSDKVKYETLNDVPRLDWLCLVYKGESI